MGSVGSALRDMPGSVAFWGQSRCEVYLRLKVKLWKEAGIQDQFAEVDECNTLQVL